MVHGKNHILLPVNRGLKTSQKQDLKIGHRKVRAN